MSEQNETEQTETIEDNINEVEQTEDNTEQETEQTAEQSEASQSEAPEKYEFGQIDGVDLDETVIGGFSDVAKEIGLSQEQAGAVVEKIAPLLAQREAQRVAEITQAWGEEAKQDKEIGGEQFDENLSVAKQALDAYGTDELKSILDESGIGNHKEVIKFMWRVGQTLQEDRLMSGDGGSSHQDARDLYPNTQLNP